MKRTPLITLLGGIALFAVLIVVNMVITSGDDEPQEETAVIGESVTASPTPAATAASPSPAPPAQKVNAVWGGQVDGGAATLAIAVTEGVAVAYLCDGKKVEAWLQGTAADGKLSLTGKNNATLAGTFGGGKATGTVTASGKQWTFTAPAIAAPAGLYRAVADVRAAKVVGGWIVLPDGSQVGIVTTDGVPGPAGPLTLPAASAVVDGATITAVPVTGPLN
jgi:hypothetical protein